MLTPGDLWQGLPVVSHGTHADMVHATVTCAPFWAHVQTLCLMVTMRLGQDHTEKVTNFAAWLLSIGGSHGPLIDGEVQLLPSMPLFSSSTHSNLMDAVYPNLAQTNIPDVTCCQSFFDNCVILAAHNVCVD